MLEKGMLATLTDGKKYIVMSIIGLDDNKYVLLSENGHLDNIKFCIEETEKDKIKLTEVEDLTLKQSLLTEFANRIQQEIK